MSKTDQANVNVKSTKQEIWEAYQGVMQNLSDQPESTTVSKKMNTLTTSLKEKLLAESDTIHHEIVRSINQLTQDMTQAAEFLDELNTFRQNQKNALALEKQEIVNQRKRDEEEYGYEFEKRKRRQEDELREQREKADIIFKTREEELKKSEAELKNLREQVATFDKLMAVKVKEEVEKTSRELTTTFTHEKQLAEQKAKSQEELLTQKIASLTAELASSGKEIERLHTQLGETGKQLSRIAERAVEKPAPITSPKREE